MPIHSTAEHIHAFLREFSKPTGHLRTKKRRASLEKLIDEHGLTPDEKIEAIRQLCPKSNPTGPRTEIRLETLFCSVDPKDLNLLKFRLDYDGDYKDIEEYIFHDIDDVSRRQRILDHFRQAAPNGPDDGSGIKVLTDVDDTLYANLVERRYPKKAIYPGVIEMYDSVYREPDGANVPPGRIPITTLSARPNPIGGILEEGSIASLTHLTGDRLLPSALSGRTVSSIIGTLETLGRKLAPGVFDGDLDDAEQAIGEVKYQNFRRYAAVYPEYRFVFFGDSGQADALTADRMLDDEQLSKRVVATFIHDLRSGSVDDDQEVASPSFLEVEKDPPPKLFISRNYIHAALQAYVETDVELISSEHLASITEIALEQFSKIASPQDGLAQQYQDDAERVCEILKKSSTEETVALVRQALNRFHP